MRIKASYSPVRGEQFAAFFLSEERPAARMCPRYRPLTMSQMRKRHPLFYELLFRAQRVVFRLLERIGCLDWEDEGQARFRRVEFSLDEMSSAILKHRRNVEFVTRSRSGPDWRARYLILGPDEFARLCAEPDPSGMMSPVAFDVPREFRANVSFHSATAHGPPSNYNGRRVEPMPFVWRGMTIIVVPWFSGMLLLPDLEKL